MRPHVRCVCDPVRCTPLASTPKSKLHRRHRPVISRDTRTYSPSRTPTKHSPQKRRRVRDSALLKTPPCATWRLTQTGIDERIQCAGQLARPHGSTGPRPARKKDVEKHDGSAVEEDARRKSAAEEALWQGLQYVWDLPQSHAQTTSLCARKPRSGRPGRQHMCPAPFFDDPR